MAIILKCNRCGYQKEIIDVSYFQPHERCAICNIGVMVVVNQPKPIKDPEDFVDSLKNKKLHEALNSLGLEGTIQQINKTPLLKKEYKQKINKLFKREMIK